MQWLSQPDHFKSSERSELEAHAQLRLDEALNNADEAMNKKMNTEVQKIVDKVGGVQCNNWIILLYILLCHHCEWMSMLYR